MQIEIPKRLTRNFIQFANPNWVFLYSCCVHNEKGFGQAEVCKGLDNCYCIPVRWSCCKSSGWFNDNDLNAKIEIDVALDFIPVGRIIIPIPKMGEGASRMKEFAPKLYSYMIDKINKIQYPLIKFI